MTLILVLNGPNLSQLGKREPEVYGAHTLADVEADLTARAQQLAVEVSCHQSNAEGDLIGLLEDNATAAACVINPGGLSHTSVALLDAMRSFPGPVVEVHISNLFAREAFRRLMVTAEGADGVIAGLGRHVYVMGLEAAVRMARDRSQ